MAAPDFSHKWETLRPAERRLTGIRLAELPDPAAEAQAIALALREALETPGKTAALVTPDRQLAARVSALLARWGIEADDSAGKPLSQTAPGTLAARHRRRPPPRSWRRCRCWRCSSIRWSAARARSGSPGSTRSARSTSAARAAAAAGLAGLDAHFAEKDAMREWRLRSRDRVASDRRAAARAAAARALRRRRWPKRRRRWPATAPGAGPTGGWRPSCLPSCRRRRPRAS